VTEGDVLRIGSTGHQEIGRVQAADVRAAVTRNRGLVA
jgi:hypothetical protein